MDDLWGNAWGSPDDLKEEGNLTTTTWSTSEKPRKDAPQEDDLSMPSWSTGPGIQWDEPSNIQSSLWSNVHHTTQDWSLENPYADIPLGNSHPPELPNEKDTVGELAVEPQSHSSPSSPTAPSNDIHTPSPSVGLGVEVSHSPTPSSPSSPEPSPPSSPDAFGTFTVGTEHSDTTPFPTIGNPIRGGLDDNEWNSPWGSMPQDADTGSAEYPSDEWESAKLRQLEMDRRVPPELLSQILLHLEELTKEAWPGNQDEVEEDWQRRWNSGMDVDGIESILLRYIPALTLPQLLPPGKSFIGKAMADAVKLSRNTTLARTSPMSTFLAAKGSTAWETSVKSRLETPSDEVPLGWRILEKDHKKDEKAEEKVKKPAGLLAGLWGRRAPNAPSNPLVPQQSTPSPNATAPEIEHPVPTQNQHPSTDGAKIPSGTAPTPQALPKPFHERTSSQDDDTHTPPSGSAVSRFLQRFSRPRASSSSPRNSLALSSDDLEFLSDVRFKSNDPSQTIDGLIAGLESETEGTENHSLHGKLPPPLPPPPKASSSSSHGATPPPRGNMLNRNTPVPPDDPVANLVSDLQGPTEKPSISALAPLTPSPTTAIDLDSPQSMSPHSVLSPSRPLPLDKIRPSFSVSAFPLLSSQPGPAFSSPSDSQSQLPLASVSTTQSFDISQDDDDFSDFRSSPAGPPLIPLNASLLSSSQGKVPLSQSSHRQSSSPFDDLVHLMSSPTTGPPDTVEEPDATPLFNFASPALPTAPSLPKPQASAHGHRASLDRPDTAPTPTTPTHSRSISQLPTSPPKATPTSPKQKMITQGHQRTQSLLNLAAARRGRWPAPPSPLPEPLSPPPPPTEKGQGGGVTNVDYFGATTPTDKSTNLPPAPPGKSSPMPSLGNVTTPQVGSSTRGSSPAPSVFDAFAQPRSGSPAITLSAPPAGQSTRRVALSPPPRPTAIMNNSSSRPPSSSPTPVPLLPPPSGYRLAAPAPAKPSPAAPLSPESTPLAFLMDNNQGTNISLPAAKATPPPPVKGAGGLTAQDLSFFEGL